MSDDGDTVPGAVDGGPNAAARPVVPVLFADGALIGNRYRVVRFIARGGMGEVYEAHDLELGEPVAVKTIRAERIGDAGLIERLKRETLAARRVSHRNVVRIHDVGFHVLADQREVAFITMDLLLGETLDAFVRRKAPLAPADALPLVTQLAAALDAAHAAGVIHRDFKPHNVILVPPGAGESEPRAVVTDFGLAEAGVDTDATSTATVEFVGTPAYMAPEQVSRREPISAAADVYAFGVVLYELVTGRRPFQAETALATAVMRLVETPVAPRQHVPTLPAAWNAVILRCLERDPRARFAGAGAALAALAARPRRRWRTAALGTLLVAALASATWAARTRLPAPRPAPSSATGTGRACGAPVGAERWVDAAAPAGGNGSADCPLRTISAALALPGASKVIHVARGIYNRELGEEFPLVLRGDVRLLGAGLEKTAIVGNGRYDTTAARGTLGRQGLQGGPRPFMATLVVGDQTGRVEVADLTLDSLPSANAIGVLCTRGNLGDFTRPLVPPNTVLRGVALGPDYTTSVLVATESAPAASGCNLRLEGAHVTGGQKGVWALGCEIGDGEIATGLEVADSTFARIRDFTPLSGAGIVAWDCVRNLDVRDSLFERGTAGIAIARHLRRPAGSVRISGNVFASLDGVGVELNRAVHVDRLLDNEFVQVSAGATAAAPAAALRLRSVDGEYATVRARHNKLMENDIGIEVLGTPAAQTTAPLVLDAGRPGDDGNNRFVCNSRAAGAPLAGGDVVLALPPAAGGQLWAHGNVWDHAPPTVRRTRQNGLDVWLAAAARLRLDVDGARATGEPCNAGLAGP